ncbi:hypothetical protein [Mangrovitalea sediminis]|uniref:hypothetical protein n=1 Tax=Mangrovitalea sediminis TaxID=1982043 RepID=UPI0011773A49|nr:hypothetical protein [Mangrovitalea sediminis]
MEITRNTPNPPAPPVAESQRGKRIGNASEAPATDNTTVRERRRRPDRREKQASLTQQDRRKRRDRRKPDILDPATGQPESLAERRGINFDVSV